MLDEGGMKGRSLVDLAESNESNLVADRLVILMLDQEQESIRDYLS